MIMNLLIIFSLIFVASVGLKLFLLKQEVSSDGKQIIEKADYIRLLRSDIVELTNYVNEIIEKDEDDIINYNNLIKALSLLEDKDVDDSIVAEIVSLFIKTNNYYNLGA